MYFISVYVLNYTIAFSMYLDTRVTCSAAFEAGTYDRHLRTDQWYSLALHV